MLAGTEPSETWFWPRQINVIISQLNIFKSMNVGHSLDKRQSCDLDF